MPRMKTISILALSSIIFAGCGSSSTPNDSGVEEDGGTVDGGPIEEDGGPIEEDGGPIEEDGGVDAGPVCETDSCAHGTCSVEDGADVCDCSGSGYAGERCDEIASVSVNFDDNDRMTDDQSAGQSPTTGWVDAQGAGPGQDDDGTLSDLMDASGASTGISLEWSCQDIEVTPLTGEGSEGDRAMMSLGCRSWSGVGDGSVTFTGLATRFPSGYRAIVYVGHGGGAPTDHNANFTLDVNDVSVTGRVESAFDGTFVELTTGAEIGNYYESDVLTDDELTLAISATGNATLPTAAINGVQIVPAS